MQEKILPPGWNWMRLEDAADINMGQSPSGTSYNENGEGTPFLQGNAEFGDTFPNHKKFTTEPSKIASKGSVLISVRAPVGDTNIADLNYCIGRGLASISLKNGDNKYLFYLLRSLQQKIQDKGTGSTFKAISKSILSDIEIPIPPLPIQHQIVTVLEHAEGVKRQRQEADALAGTLLQSVFLEMFGDPVRNEKGWDIFPIGNICEGIVPGRNKPKIFGGDIPWITPVDLDSFFVSASKQNLTIDENEVKKCKNKIIPPNSVIMTCVGDFGITAITKNRVVLNQQLHAFVCTLSVNPFYLHFYLKLRMDYFQKMATKTTVNYLNKTKCNSIPVLLPPLALQEQFAHIVESIESLREKQKDSGKEIGELLEGLMQRAFSGELVAIEA
jgi:type I restriction enzyme, S subunit